MSKEQLLSKEPLKARFILFLRKHTKNSKLCRWLEKRYADYTGGYAYNEFLRKFYKEEYGVSIGYGTYGGCWNNSSFWWRNIKIGNYCSFAGNIYATTTNHRIKWFSTHPCIANDMYGAILYDGYPDDGIEHKLEIMNDVWIGENVIILPGCKKIGNGAIVGAGSVVTHDVPPYAIVAGNPARVLRYRFDEETITQLEATQWWNLKLDELKKIAPKLQEIVGVKELRKIVI